MSVQSMVSTNWEGDASRGWLVWRMKERASFTNAVVSTAPAPIRNPRRDCSIKKSSKIAYASGGLATYCCPCGPHRRATVAGLRLVGGAVRPSQDARPSCYHGYPHCQCVDRKAVPVVPN